MKISLKYKILKLADRVINILITKTWHVSHCLLYIVLPIMIVDKLINFRIESRQGPFQKKKKKNRDKGSSFNPLVYAVVSTHALFFLHIYSLMPENKIF